MLFQRLSAQPSRHCSQTSLRRSFLPLIVLVAGTTSLAAQTTPPQAQTQTAPATDTSSSSDVQQAQVVQKPKDPYHRDVALLGFGQDSSLSNGNSLRDGTTSSGGGMISFRQSPRWWAGYEATYGYTQYSDTYFFGEYAVKHSTNELSLAYLLKSPSYGGYHVFGSIGAGLISLAPIQSAGQVTFFTGTPATQTLPLFVLSVGVEKRLTDRIGVRVQYRDDVYKSPDFKLAAIDTRRLRSTNEPCLGVYYRF
jgi:opacity protein-like surface antigen